MKVFIVCLLTALLAFSFVYIAHTACTDYATTAKKILQDAQTALTTAQISLTIVYNNGDITEAEYLSGKQLINELEAAVRLTPLLITAYEKERSDYNHDLMAENIANLVSLVYRINRIIHK